MLCILYVIAVGTLLGAIALLIERALPTTWARRWIWVAAIPISLFLPGYYRGHHNWAVTTLEQPQAPSLTPLDRDWWARTRSYDSTINRVWLITSGLLLVLAVTNAMRISHLVSSSRQTGERRRQLIVGGHSILVTDQVGPATVGVLRSQVLMPRWVLALPEAERQYVLQHEEEHRRSHDALLLFVASLPLILMPWNLAMWWLLRRLCLAVEVDCDNRVVAALGDARAYGELLLKVAEAGSHGPRLQPAFLGGAGSLERRLTELLAPTPLRRVQRYLVPAAAVALFLLVLWMPHPILAGDSHQHGSVTSISTTTPGKTP
jgi:beta-lactamase regulating signal transducer with metallopeptidase domain